MSVRDNFTQTVKDTLAKRVGYICSNPSCKRFTAGPGIGSSGVSMIGVAAHICAASPGGPRYDANMDPKERKSIDNGIWLCQNCAHLIDTDTEKYTVEVLKGWKQEAEQWAHNSISMSIPASYVIPNINIDRVNSTQRLIEDGSFLIQPCSSGVSIGTVYGPVIINSGKIQKKSTASLLQKESLEESLNICKSYAYELEIDALKNELSRLFSEIVEENEFSRNLHFLELLTLLRDGSDITIAAMRSGAEYKQEAEWIIEFYKAPFALTAEEYGKHIAVTQIFIIDKLFTEKFWNHIVLLHNTLRDIINPVIRCQFDLYYALSLYNLNEKEKASSVLHTLLNASGKRKIQFYAILADISIENNVFQSGSAGNQDRLALLIEQLNSFKGEKRYSLQEQVVAELELEACFHLAKTDRSYLERAIGEFESYSEQTRQTPAVRFYYALCLEMKGRPADALKIYAALDWKNNPVLAERYMLSLLLYGQADKALEIYNKVDIKNGRVDGVYLLTLAGCGKGSYLDELNRLTEGHRHSLSEFLPIACYTNNELIVRDYIIPVLKELMDEQSLATLHFYQKIEMLTFLAHCKQIELLETVLATIENVAEVNRFTVCVIYEALFVVVSRNYSYANTTLEIPADLSAADRISDRFIAKHVAEELFYQIKVMCAGANRLPVSMLELAKKQFALTQDATTAYIIVSCLHYLGKKKPAEYELYLDVLKKSNVPEHCMMAAYAILVLGKTDEAGLFAYKALYLLNEREDYGIYLNFFNFFNKKIFDDTDTSLQRISGSVVVTLEECGQSGTSGTHTSFDVCLESEADFVDACNRSMGVEHLTNSDLDYVRLQGVGLGEEINLRNKIYRVIQILPRWQYGYVFVLRKIQQNPEKCKGVVWTIPADEKNINELLTEFKNIADSTKSKNSFLEIYNFKNNNTGLPIDVFAGGDYERYINTVKYLLFTKDEAFFAGEAVYENEEGQLYVPALATLILLSVLGRLDVLTNFLQDIIIPESYVSFFKKEYEKAVGKTKSNALKLLFADDKPVILDSDRSIPEIWEMLLDLCSMCKVYAVTDQERMDVTIVEGLTLERVITGMELNIIHLDALLLANREEATFLCDDLFFRKIASYMHLRSINIVSLIRHYTNSDSVMEFLLMLSKTNYIYIPLIYRTDEEAKQLYNNVMDGEKKKLYYGALIGEKVQ